MNLEQVLSAIRQGGKVTNPSLKSRPLGHGPIPANVEEAPVPYITKYPENGTLILVNGQNVSTFQFGHLSNDTILGDEWEII